MRKTVIAAALALSLVLSGCGSAEATGEAPERSGGASARFDGAVVGIGLTYARVITDNETGVQYLFVTDWYDDSGFGGLTVLVDADDKPLTAKEADNG